MKKPTEKAFTPSPGKLIFIIAAAVFISESISMAVIFSLQPFRSTLLETFIDASLLIVLLSPILYLFVFLPMLRNIEERREAEESLKKLNQELQSTASQLALAYKDMESFSYSVSHDLRAPLRIIGGMSDILLNDYSDRLDEEGMRLLTSIRGNTERMDKLVMSLLDLSRVGRQEMKMDEIDMGKEAALIAQQLRGSAPGRNIEITIDNLPPAHGDVTLIRQVLANLLSNAVKFTREKEAALITVGGRSDNFEEVYYVRDNGAGFDEAHSDKLFGVFQRLHSKEQFEGIGIGLSIVGRIVNRHGGRVWAEGRPGEGATFYFSLPRKTS